MKLYRELTLLPNTECNNYFLWSTLYAQLHLALRTIQNNKNIVSIGAAFPEYSTKPYCLGTKLRLFVSDEADLVALDVDKWIYSIRHYIHVSELRSVPLNIKEYAVYHRVQAKSNNTRLARRKAKRSGISFEEASNLFISHDEKQLQLPYINMQSLKSKQRFRLFINKRPVTELINNSFNSYGLSNISSIPEFF